MPDDTDGDVDLAGEIDESAEVELESETGAGATDEVESVDAEASIDEAGSDDALSEPQEPGEQSEAAVSDCEATETADESQEARLERERDEYLSTLRQVQADFENYRKRSFKQQGEAIERATGRLVEDLLPVLDACDAGIEHGDEGVTAVFTTLLGVLERNGLERLDPLGADFDPNAHEAVLHEPADDDADPKAEPVVVEVMRTGYRWKERTLRAAMVKVKG